LILAECKNWTGKCGKNEFVLFHQKLENRSQRSTLGMLISWVGDAIVLSVPAVELRQVLPGTD